MVHGTKWARIQNEVNIGIWNFKIMAVYLSLYQ